MIQNTMLPLNNVTPLKSITPVQKGDTPAEITNSFSQFLADALQQVDAQERQVHTLNDKFIVGEASVDQVMVASERSILGLQLTTQVRNKMVEAYQEIMRMQV
ncbi:flagellar hook-basal body complex protein FliE [Paenibacillus sp. 481]|uniref:flagellar hook-basal body complex protein FliE n=1 Tax=Paenibacillus sp. 481 TaxID=2835869 RepID=UPI001E60C1C5|nr:flagellar hook-basal body complex protein FliE [Paenibacillus sp. 481]UHA73940.1 flagellar hook-basal body complex protein FliE [Paenibacillus sp. 481]